MLKFQLPIVKRYPLLSEDKQAKSSKADSQKCFLWGGYNLINFIGNCLGGRKKFPLVLFSMYVFCVFVCLFVCRRSTDFIV